MFFFGIQSDGMAKDKTKIYKLSGCFDFWNQLRNLSVFPHPQPLFLVPISFVRLIFYKYLYINVVPTTTSCYWFCWWPCVKSVTYDLVNYNEVTSVLKWFSVPRTGSFHAYVICFWILGSRTCRLSRYFS